VRSMRLGSRFLRVSTESVSCQPRAAGYDVVTDTLRADVRTTSVMPSPPSHKRVGGYTGWEG